MVRACIEHTPTVVLYYFLGKGEKTVVVNVERKVKHPLYGKIVRRSSKVHAHDAQNECEVGDVVTVREAPPMSKTKTWQLVSIDERPAKV